MGINIGLVAFLSSPPDGTMQLDISFTLAGAVNFQGTQSDYWPMLYLGR
jgi:hypothetical protein